MTTFSAIHGDECMKRAILVALGIGVIVTSATALDVSGTRPAGTTAALHHDPVHVARSRDSARADQRARIDERYLAERNRCSSLSGYRRDKCLVQAHATRGRAMLEAAAPYEVRFQAF
jgi:hypothetical protein